MTGPSTDTTDTADAGTGAESASVAGDAAHDAGSDPETDVVRLTEASVRLDGRTVWERVTLRAGAGEFIGVLGPNGAGKSTLLKALLGVVPLSGGEVRVLGRPVRRGNAQVSYLPQRRVFDADVRVRGRDLVRLGLEGTRWGVPLPALRILMGAGARVRAERRRLDEVLDLVGATSYADRPIGEISGGEQQRVLIAQALITRPRLLLLDEPLEGLDLANQQGVAAVIQRIRREERVTVLLVAHDVNPLLPYLDRVVYLAGGRVLSGTPEEVITTATLSQLYGAPVEVVRTPSGRVLVAGQPAENVCYHG